jgi:acyl-coenzyme A synthetase/AMP-(fatty) acid ligase
MNAVEHSLLHGLAVSGADAPAVVSAGESLTYGALTARVSRFAAALRAAGLAPCDRVATQMIDTPDLVALHLAVMAAGGVAAPISTRAGADELRQTLSIIEPTIMVVDGEFAEGAAGSIGAATPTTKLVLRERELFAWKTRPKTELAPDPREPGDPAFWVMTSGTTGQPKAVEHCHANVGICAQYFEQVLGAKPADRLFATSRFHFSYALGTMFAALRLGATNILLERWATAESVAASIERHAPTVVLSVPVLYHKLIGAGLARTPAFRAVRHYVSAGERLPPRLGMDWEAACGHPIFDGMGCSELVYMVLGNTPQSRCLGSSGRPLPSVEVRLVGQDGTVIREPGRAGQLEVRMPSVCSGYRVADAKRGDPPQRPPDRFKPGGWFATGDEYMQDADGFFHHRGRSGDMLRASSMWVSPSEIEDPLAGIPSIAEAAAVLGKSAVGLEEIVLFVVPAAKTEGRAALEAARQQLARILPEHKRPRRFELVAELPRTATGKVQRHKLRQGSSLSARG